MILSYSSEFESGGYNISEVKESESEGITVSLVTIERSLQNYVLRFHLRHEELDEVICEAKQDKTLGPIVFLESYPLNYFTDDFRVRQVLSQALIRMRSVR